MDANTRTIYERLKELARVRQTGFYEDIAEIIGLGARSPEFFQILNTINAHEHQEGRPLLSALVVAKGYGVPGPGFFSNARELGRYAYDGGDSTTHVTFWVSEVHRVWDYWGNH